MEEKVNFRTYLKVAIRLAVLVLLIAIIIFFVVTFVRSRQSDQSSSRTNSSQGAVGSESTSSRESKDTKAGTNNNSVSDQDENREVTQNSQSVPAVGMSSSLLSIAFGLGLMTYMLARSLDLYRNTNQEP